MNIRNLQIGDIIQLERAYGKPVYLQLESAPIPAPSPNPYRTEDEWLFVAKSLRKDLRPDLRSISVKPYRANEWKVIFIKRTKPKAG